MTLSITAAIDKQDTCLLQTFVVTALQMFSLDGVNASEFLEVYKGVVAPGEFQGMLDELTSGKLP